MHHSPVTACPCTTPLVALSVRAARFPHRRLCLCFRVLLSLVLVSTETTVKDALLAVPAYYTQSERLALTAAVELAGLSVRLRHTDHRTISFAQLSFVR